MESGHGHFACGLVDLDSHDRSAPCDLPKVDYTDSITDHAPAQKPFGPSNNQLAHLNPPESLNHATCAGDFEFASGVRILNSPHQSTLEVIGQPEIPAGIKFSSAIGGNLRHWPRDSLVPGRAFQNLQDLHFMSGWSP
jgi:hypothetical protein